MKILVTGGAGFIGSHYVRSLLAGAYPGTEEVRVTVVDLLTYAGNPANVPTDHERLDFVKADIRDADVLRDMLRATPGDHLRAVRDRALLAFGMAGAFRRSEWGPKATLPHLLVVLAKPRRRLKSHNDAAIQPPSRSDPHIAITTDLHRPRTGCF